MNKIRKYGALIAVVLLTMKSYGQLQSEWLQQKKTQKKYLLEQIVALQAQLGFIKDGYKVAGAGLNWVSGTKNNEKQLHSDYFTSLITPGNALKQDKKVDAIIDMQQHTSLVLNDAVSDAVDGGQITTTELQEIRTTRSTVLKEADADLEALKYVLSSGNYVMTDEQRISRVDKIFQQAQNRYGFSKTYATRIRFITAQRQKNALDMGKMKRLHNLKK